ncbi:MAG: exodeoxyribonuclease V subunit alpha [Actinomycetota bacterium]
MTATTAGAETRPRNPATAAFAAATTDFLVRHYRIADAEVIGLIDSLTAAIAEGHGCLAIDPGDPVTARLRSFVASGLVTEVATFDDPQPAPLPGPLVLWGSRLFAQRQFTDELDVARALVKRAGRPFPALDRSSVVDLIDRVLPVLEPERTGDAPDAVANLLARSMLTSGFNVLTGGPGTGKTHTLVRGLALFARAHLDGEGRLPRIALCAPTGKAATRAREMTEAFVRSSDARDDEHRRTLGAETITAIAEIEPQTIHRLLGRDPGTIAGFRHGPDNPIEADIVVVDETSMVPLALMVALLGAIGPDTRLLLVGDEAQLESVELGAVLAQMVRSRAALERAAGRPVVHELTKVHRIAGDSAVGDLARAVRAGAEDAVIAHLEQAADGSASGVTWARSDRNTSVSHAVIDQVAADLTPAVAIALEPRPADDVALRRALTIIEGTKVLCGPRHGAVGVAAWNAAIAERLGLGAPDRAPAGTPVLVTVNAPHLGLVNGSIGLAVQIDTPDGPVDRIAFSIGGEIRTFDRSALPAWEPCFAMTVHKSQGSEYGELVVAALPGEASPLLTRELLYTAVTRAKKNVVVVGSEQSVRTAVSNESSRVSGIAAMVEVLAATT